MKSFLPRRPRTADVVRKRVASSAILPLAPVIALGSWSVLIDAIDGMTASGGNLGTATDLGGAGRAISFNGVPTFSATKWGGTRPACQFAVNQGLRAFIAASLSQPFSFFAVIDALSVGALQNNVMTCDDAGANITQIYVQGSGTVFNLYSGNPVSTTINATATKMLLMATFSGASSVMFNGSTSGGTVNAGTLLTGTRFGVGTEFGNNHPVPNMILAACGIRAGAFSPSDRALLLSTFASRYPGIAP